MEREKPLNVKIIYEWGSAFYVKHDSMQKKRLLTRVEVTENGLLYGLSCDGEYEAFFRCELSETVDPSFDTIPKKEDNE